MANNAIQLDCVILGGGAAGLLILEKCVSLGHQTLLLESNALGFEQTIDSQGMVLDDPKDINTSKDISLLWRRMLAGESETDLSKVNVRSEYCHLWSTASIQAKLGWMANKLANKNSMHLLSKDERPVPLQHAPFAVARLSAQVIEPRSLLEVLSQAYDAHILKIAKGGMEISRPNGRWLVRLLNPETGEPLDLMPNTIILAASSETNNLRTLLGLPELLVRKIPIQMVMVRGDIPIVNGWCIDGLQSHIKISTTIDFARRRVWQIQSKLSRNTASNAPEQLIYKTAHKIQEAIKGEQCTDLEFLTYHTTHVHIRNNTDSSILQEEGVLTCTCSTLSQGPRCAQEIAEILQDPTCNNPNISLQLTRWPKPEIALPRWETDQPWTTLESSVAISSG